jgi:hypothetical protein
MVHSLCMLSGMWEMAASEKKIPANKGKLNAMIGVQQLAHTHDGEMVL